MEKEAQYSGGEEKKWQNGKIGGVRREEGKEGTPCKIGVKRLKGQKEEEGGGRHNGLLNL